MVNPFFSIIIPTCNRPHLLARALASVANQNFDDYELIIVNDGSSVSYDGILEECGLRLGRYIVHESSKGVSAARNAGIAAAQGKWIAFLDDDDEYAEGFLREMQRRLLDAPEGVGFGWTSVVFQHYDADGNPAWRASRTYDAAYSSEKEFFERAITIGTGFGLTVKKECFEKIGPFDSNLRLGEDTDLVLKLLAAGYQAVILPEPGVTVHCRHASGLDQSLLDRVRSRIFLHLADRHIDIFRRHPDMFVIGLGWGVWASYFCGDFAGGDRLLLKIFRAAPTHSGVWKCVMQNLSARMRFTVFPRKRLGISFSR